MWYRFKSNTSLDKKVSKGIYEEVTIKPRPKGQDFVQQVEGVGMGGGGQGIPGSSFGELKKRSVAGEQQARGRAKSPKRG